MTPSQLESRKTQFIDCEMLCWPNKQIPEGQSNHIIQIGIVEVDAINFTITRSQGYYVRPKNKNFDVSEYCTNLTGITKETLLSKGKYFPEIMKTIQKEFGTRNRVTYAWGNDHEPIRAQCLLHGCENPWSETGIWDFGVLFRQAFCLKTKLPLSKALERVNLPFPGKAHDAVNDATALANLHIEMMNRIRNFK